MNWRVTPLRRRGGELGETSFWVAQRPREAGLKPAGEDGTYFQFFNQTQPWQMVVLLV
jgi:hypothetical protein